jgi:HD-GYP domain-containing protein (c-di-GMP phosphodiesterase class II)
MPFNHGLIKALEDWEFKQVLCGGEASADYAGARTMEVQDAGLKESDSDRIQKAKDFYSSFLKYMDSIYISVKVGKDVKFDSIAEKIRDACDVIREDKRFLLRVQRHDIPSIDENYQAFNSVKTMVISVIIGIYLKLPHHRLIELGVSALMHDIGMRKLPPQVYLVERALWPHEKKAIMAHPIFGFNLLKSYSYPLSIALGALEHHERENGSGYPRKLTGDKISLYAKIIAVAGSYEALSSKRPHKDAKDGFTGMLELLKNEGKQYDDTIVRALVYSLSIYPIGLYVLLSNGFKGQVIDVNPEKPRFPVVQVFGRLTPDGKNEMLQTSPNGVSIVRPLTRQEIGPKQVG